MEYKLELDDTDLYFDHIKGCEDELMLTRIGRRPGKVTVPSEIKLPFGSREGEILPITKIGRKAFFGQKKCKIIELPETVTEFGEWAFASCTALESVTLPAALPGTAFGKGCFQNCTSLRELKVRGATEDLAFLLASVAVRPAVSFLLNTGECGDAEWLRQYDHALTTRIAEADNEGFSNQILCGEEDYGSTDITAYESRRRKEKCSDAFIRLMHDTGLASDTRQYLADYLLSHTAGSPDGEESWLVILDEHGEDREWYSFFAEIGCKNSTNIDRILNMIGDRFPEMKSFFLNDSLGAADLFFDSLEL